MRSGGLVSGLVTGQQGGTCYGVIQARGFSEGSSSREHTRGETFLNLLAAREPRAQVNSNTVTNRQSFQSMKSSVYQS